MVLLAVVATPAVATTVTESPAADTVDVGSEVDVTYTLTDLYSATSDNWTLRVSTELAQPTWTIATYDNQGNQIGDNRTVTESNFTQAIGGSTTKVVIRLQGTVERPANFTYQPAQNVTLATFDRVQGNAVTDIKTDTARPETTDSRQARNAIENASDAIENASDAGAGVSGAKETLQSAIDAYNGENFDNAATLAEEAETKAQNAKQSTEQQNTLLLVGAGIVVLLLLAGGVYWYLNRGEEYDELG
ncbi:MAG: hypothetical protein ABEJ68_04960 [Halobacteriaceae archaeon]